MGKNCENARHTGPREPFDAASHHHQPAGPQPIPSSCQPLHSSPTHHSPKGEKRRGTRFREGRFACRVAHEIVTRIKDRICIRVDSSV